MVSRRTTLITSAALFSGTFLTSQLPALAKNDLRAIVQPFYDLLSDAGAPDADERTAKFMDDNWESIPTPRGGTGREGFVKSLAMFHDIIPDLNWDVQEMLVSDNRVIVRSTATGTPVKPFFGVQPSGRSFNIMTIDIHTVENDKIVRSYHVEEWATAITQLSNPQ